jgi:hypothetical protein
MFDKVFYDALHGVGTIVAHEGKNYVILGHNSWQNDQKQTVEVLTVMDASIQVEVGIPLMAETKCIVRLKPPKSNPI